MKNLENILNLKFKNSRLLFQALTHRSYLNESKKNFGSNERLEFLGDAVLELIVSEYLFNLYPSFPEGKLTNFRSSLVKTPTLAKVAKKIQLGKFLKMSRGEEDGAGRENQTLLANALEALIGALYLDKGVDAVKKFLSFYLFPFLSEIIKTGAYKDYKSYFQEIVQEKTKISPVYKVITEQGPDHDKKFIVGVYLQEKLLGKGKGRSKQEAEQMAAHQGIEKWKKEC